jgi:hypothetical protein
MGLTVVFHRAAGMPRVSRLKHATHDRHAIATDANVGGDARDDFDLRVEPAPPARADATE